MLQVGQREIADGQVPQSAQAESALQLGIGAGEHQEAGEDQPGIVKEAHPDVPIIGFPKGAGAHYAGYRRETGVTALGLDWTVPLGTARRLQAEGAVQGNLDPLRLIAGGEALHEGVAAILDALRHGPFIFNLGHGITPKTPVEHVEAMLKQIREAE